VRRSFKTPPVSIQQRRLRRPQKIIATQPWPEPSADLLGDYRVVFIPD
jgi:hypothetical protein